MKPLCLALSIAVITASPARALQAEFPLAQARSDSAWAAIMPEIAEWALASYADPDRGTELDNRFRLQMVAGRYEEADRTIDELQTVVPGLRGAALPYAVHSGARRAQAEDGSLFKEAYARSFRETFAGLDDRTAANQARWVFGTSLIRLRREWSNAVDQLAEWDAVDLTTAVDLVRRFLAVEVYAAFQPYVPDLMVEDDQRRYAIEKDHLVKTPDGATICAFVVRPRAANDRLPSLLHFTIYADSAQMMHEARRTASHGYAAVEGLTRGKGCSPDEPVPMEHDGEDATALIGWIAEQSWSDGRVGMYGGSYEGFVQWATARRFPPGLKAIMPSVAFAPGIDFPMDGQVFMNYAYPWPFYVTNVKDLDDATYFDSQRWEKLNREWYTSGSSYRDLDTIDGHSNPLFDRWLDHPSYDEYWSHFVPSEDEFARITIPILTTTGYYDSGQTGALHYFREHQEQNPEAEHYLLIGPYDHISGQRGTITPLGRRSTDLRGYELDPTAHIDIGELRYEWFDYVLRGGERPSLLKDKVNFQVMGANEWRHVPSVDAMSIRTTRLYLAGERAGDDHRLSDSEGKGSVTQRIDFTDRSDIALFSADGGPIDQTLDSWNIVDTVLNIANSVRFVTDPLATVPEVSGSLSGELDFIASKQDFDFSVTLYEWTAEGEYIYLSHVWVRASYARDRTRRQLLVPGERTKLPFESARLISRQFAPGSRLVVVLGVLKQPGAQINYGTGGDVSDETIADAGEPLRIEWFGDSFVDLPQGR